MGVRLDNATALYMEAIRDGDLTAIDRYTGERYTQHSTPVKDGREGFVEFFTDFVARNPIRDIEIVRAFEDEQYVFLHAVQTLNDGEFRYVTADIFDTDADGKLIEHWDMIAEITDDTVSGHSQFDGPTEPTDLHLTDANKALVRGFLENVLRDGDLDRIGDYISSATYIQHNPQVGDGLDGLADFVARLAEQGAAMTYDEIHRVIGCGSFVASLSKLTLAGTEMAAIDLFRVEDGRIVEHWDVMEELTPEATWVNSGKF